jgi:hypothetical protein
MYSSSAISSSNFSNLAFAFFIKDLSVDILSEFSMASENRFSSSFEISLSSFASFNRLVSFSFRVFALLTISSSFAIFI